MSTSVILPPSAPAVTRFAWKAAAASSAAVDLVLPSLIAQRAAAAERDGYDRGFKEGEHAGQEAARLRAEAKLTRLSATIDEIAALRTGMLKKSEQDVARLAVAIADRILHREIGLDRELLVTMARAAARQLGEQGVVRILMNPEDFLAISAQGGSAPENGPIRCEADANVPPGGCLVQSSFGTIDVSLETQIREVIRGLLGDDAAAVQPAGNHDDAGETGARG
jgi:flagellar assembly protein FliH